MKKLAAAAGLLLSCAIAPAHVSAEAASTRPATEVETAQQIEVLVEKVRRLASGRQYKEALDTLDEALALAPLPGRAQGNLQFLRGMALIELGRFSEAEPAFEKATAMLTRNDPFLPKAYLAWSDMQLRTGQPVRASQSIVHVASHFPDELKGLNKHWLYDLYWTLQKQDHKEALFELLLALSVRGYDGGDGPGGMDWMYSEAALELAKRGRFDEAGQVAAALIQSNALLNMLVNRHFEPLWPLLEERVGLDMARHLATEHDASLEALQQHPEDLKALLRHVDVLLYLGRHDDALALTTPIVSDLKSVVETGEDAIWIAYAHAHALAFVGRVDHAEHMMTELINLGIGQNPNLKEIAFYMINDRSQFLLAHDRPEDVLRIVDQNKADYWSRFSKYAKMRQLRDRTCALVALGRQAEASEAMRQIEELKTENMTAYTHALLCHDRLDEAEQAVLERLADEDERTAMLVTLQNFQQEENAPHNVLIITRLASLRERPAVQKAIASAGRILPIAGAATVWGAF